MNTVNRLLKSDLDAIRNVHPFARTLGPGPYRFVGMFSINLEAGRQGRPYVNPHEMHPNFVSGCGTCSHCGMAILNIYQVQTGNGEVFGVGSDCVHKLDLDVRELTKAERAKRDADKAKRAARKSRKGSEARGELSEMIQFQADTMARLPHPSMPHRSDLTLLDYASWVLERSNDGGIVIALGRVKYALTGAVTLDAVDGSKTA